MPEFVGTGEATALGGPPAPWINARGEEVTYTERTRSRHPAAYQADPDLVEAVRTAMILAKPLLLTGRPGTGKSELAERIAWEFKLGRVLRFEAQSLTEAQELFYRFDLVGQMADAQLAPAQKRPPMLAEHFLTFGPLGKAIIYANPGKCADLIEWDRRNDANTGSAADTAEESLAPPQSGIMAAPAGEVPARQSVVLIDEIDKAARDVPNDLLNGIERMEFRIRDLRNRLVAAPDDEALRPIVVITSNSERDLPEPFLRRCAFYHIPDPDADKLRAILRARVAGVGPGPGDAAGFAPPEGAAPLPPFYEALLAFFVGFRDQPPAPHVYRPGTTELLDWSRALQRLGADPGVDLAGNRALLARTVSAVAKHRDDLVNLREAFQRQRLALDPNPGAGMA